MFLWMSQLALKEGGMDKRNRKYVWVERPRRGPLGERRWDQVARTEDRSTAEEMKLALEAAGHRVYVRNSSKYPCT